MFLIDCRQYSVVLGLLGTAVSLMLYLCIYVCIIKFKLLYIVGVHGCCRPTFYRIWKKKSTEGFQAIPYSVALFSAMLYLYYAFLKQNSIILITINTIGCVTEIAYLTVYMIYATKVSRVRN